MAPEIIESKKRDAKLFVYFKLTFSKLPIYELLYGRRSSHFIMLIMFCCAEWTKELLLLTSCWWITITSNEINMVTWMPTNFLSFWQSTDDMQSVYLFYFFFFFFLLFIERRPPFWKKLKEKKKAPAFVFERKTFLANNKEPQIEEKCPADHKTIHSHIWWKWNI